MKTQFKRFVTEGDGHVPIHHKGYSRTKASGRRYTHPYLRPEFWAQPANQFWLSDKYTQKAKDYLSAHISDQGNGGASL